jgi:hypothetical protein
MKRVAILMAVLALAAGCDDDSPTQPSNTGPIVFTATMTAAQEVPPISDASESGGRGTVTITFNVPRDASGAITGGGSATFVGTLSGFPTNPNSLANNAHIHPGAAGVSGGVLVNANLNAAPITLDNSGNGSFNLTQSNLSQADATAIAANPAGYYFNVHTSKNGAGAVRGQLVRQ